MSDSDYGTPFDENSTDPIDDWSRAVFEACRGCALAEAGRWYRWDEGWIYLRIEEVDGERLEPLFAIELGTHEWQLLLDFGSWATPISYPGDPLEQAAQQAVAEARALIESWLRGEVRIASYSDETGWRCSKTVPGAELPGAIEQPPREIGAQARVIVKTPRRSEWRSWRRMDDGHWLECEVHEG